MGLRVDNLAWVRGAAGSFTVHGLRLVAFWGVQGLGYFSMDGMVLNKFAFEKQTPTTEIRRKRRFCKVHRDDGT